MASDMKTVVLQSFRTSDVPAWMERCMASVRAWAELRGYDYEFMDDRIFALCGADYLAQVGDNKRSITNLARLELIRLRLAGTYERAIWLDADTFVFAPAAFRMDIGTGYAFAREVWVYRDAAGHTFVDHTVHNASCVFTRNQPDLDFFIRTVRYIAATRQIQESFQVGVRLLSGLQYPLCFPLLQDSGMFSSEVVHALATGDDGLLAILARGHAHPVHAANLGFSLLDAASPLSTGMPEDLVMTAMDRLEQSAGAVINRFYPAPEFPAAIGPIITTFRRGREEASFYLNSPTWLLARALRLLAARVLPARLTSALRRVRRRRRPHVAGP
jgi:hypothetical protein